jgi:radical SAM superfamily enzyme YgiQ (UPF0313 family)
MNRNSNFKILFLLNNVIIGSDPIGVMQLSAIAKQHNCDTSLCLTNEKYIEKIRKYNPNLVAISMMSPDFPKFKEVTEKIKCTYPEIPIIVGGPHPTFKPEIIKTLGVDAICVGEGDIAFAQTIENLKNGDNLNDIKNIYTKTKINKVEPLINELDSLPFIDRELIYRHIPSFAKFKLRVFYTSRGCPYHCSYCFNHAYNKLYKGLGKIVRKRSVNNIVEEIKGVINNYPTKFIKFCDDSFVHRVDPWLEEFAEKYRNKINLPFYCLIRPDRVNEKMVKLLKYAGCKSVCMSIEAGNEKIRKEVLNRNVSNKQLISAFDMFNRHDIKIFTNSMIGIPGSTYSDEIETLNMNLRCKPAHSGYTICTPYIGTDIYEYCLQHQHLEKRQEDRNTVNDMNDFSSLVSYTKKEKIIQKNMALLFPLVVFFPKLKNIVIEYLIRLPTNLIYYAINFLVLKYQLKKYIIPLKYTLAEQVILFKELLKDLMNSLKKKSSI